jgi:hypothetical protein
MTPDHREMLLYPRLLQDDTGRRSDLSEIIARFKLGDSFPLKTNKGVLRFAVTRIDEKGIWGMPEAPR